MLFICLLLFFFCFFLLCRPSNHREYRFLMGGTKKIRYLLLLCATIIILFTIKWFQNDADMDGYDHNLYSSIIGKSKFMKNIQNNEKWTPVVVMVYYEALCPDSKFFITGQLMNLYKKAPILIDFDLIPYGKATTIFHANNDVTTYDFECQHGKNECLANLYHSCTIDLIKDKELQLNMIGCMIKDNRLPIEQFEFCANELKILNKNQIHKCTTSLHGKELLKLNGDMTNALRPKITFIPTVTLNGSQEKQSAILKNLMKEVCKLTDNYSIPINFCNF